MTPGRQGESSESRIQSPLVECKTELSCGALEATAWGRGRGAHGRTELSDHCKNYRCPPGFGLPCLLYSTGLSKALRDEFPRRSQVPGGLRLCHSVTSHDTDPPSVILPSLAPLSGVRTPAPPSFPGPDVRSKPNSVRKRCVKPKPSVSQRWSLLSFPIVYQPPPSHTQLPTSIW